MTVSTTPGNSGMTLVLGGARSGKSRHAEGLVTAYSGPWTYVATGQAFDGEMQARIAAHRDRRGAGWRTVEAPLDCGPALATPGPLLLDCLTLWLANVMMAERDVAADCAALEAAVAARDGATVLVGSEVGLGIVPETALGRRFRDAAGLLHQALAARADAVVFMVAGLPMRVK